MIDGRTVPDPVAALVSRWAVDPWTRGAWAALRPTAPAGARATLAAPLADRLFFAGEAVTTDAPGTLVGAHRSGRRSADLVAARWPPSARLVVIGAGIAGLAAARRWDDRLGLAATVLEARGRVGGRIDTAAGWGGPPVELGAVHLDSGGGDLVELAEQLGLATTPTPGTSPSAGGASTIRWTGGAVPSRVVDQARVLERRFSALLDETVVAAPRGASLAGALTEARSRLIQEQPATDDAVLAVVDLLADLDRVLPRAAAPDGLAASEGLPAPDPTSGTTAVVGGNLRLPVVLAQDMDVRVATPATLVRWSAAGVVVETSSGPVRADAVIVTVPVGALQAGVPAFDPPLPAATSAALVGLEPGRFEQAHLRFPRRFWGAARTIERVDVEVGRWPRFTDADAGDDRAPPVLRAVAAGGGAGPVASRDEVVVADVLSALRSTYG